MWEAGGGGGEREREKGADGVWGTIIRLTNKSPDIRVINKIIVKLRFRQSLLKQFIFKQALYLNIG